MPPKPSPSAAPNRSSSRKCPVPRQPPRSASTASAADVRALLQRRAPACRALHPSSIPYGKYAASTLHPEEKFRITIVPQTRSCQRIGPPKAAGVTDHLWEVSDLVTLWEEYERGL